MKTTPAQLVVTLALLLTSLPGCVGPGHDAVAFEGNPERDAVLAVVARSFEAISAKGEESAKIWREVLLPEGSMSSVRLRDGALAVNVQDFAAHFQDLADRPDPRPSLERLWDPTVLVDGDVAMVWARYDFWLDGELSHGGTDVVVLLRTNDGWRIASFAWTAEFDAPPSPLGPPKY